MAQLPFAAHGDTLPVVKIASKYEGSGPARHEAGVQFNALLLFDNCATVPIVVPGLECDAPIDTLKEILETLIDQHLQAKDLPISIPAIYTAADGTTWPGLVVDGVYDLGSQYRVDLVITNDAEVTALKAKGLSWFDDDTDVTPHDPDFD